MTETKINSEDYDESDGEFTARIKASKEAPAATADALDEGVPGEHASRTPADDPQERERSAVAGDPTGGESGGCGHALNYPKCEPCAFCHRCDCASSTIRQLEKETARLGEVVRIVSYMDRSRGYPTPKEWEEIVRLANAALKGEA